MGKLIEGKCGYEFMSDNKVMYELNLGMDLERKWSSDICFIMLKWNKELFDILDPSGMGDVEEFIGYLYGAEFILSAHHQKEYIEIIDNYVANYETEHPEIVKWYAENEITEEEEKKMEYRTAVIDELGSVMFWCDKLQGWDQIETILKGHPEWSVKAIEQ